MALLREHPATGLVIPLLLLLGVYALFTPTNVLLWLVPGIVAIVLAIVIDSRPGVEA